MRTLLLMRGAPGCGKSTWIKKWGLEQYTLCPDDIRVLCSSTEFQPDGSFKISQNMDNENAVWEILFKILEHRMSRGEFTVIDATCSKTKDIQRYKDLASSYRYRMAIIDFTDVPLEVCLKQNKMRPEWKHVPDAAIKNIYARFATQKIPSSVTVIKPDEYNTLLEQPIDLSTYKKVVMVGDIHGCYDTLMQYLDFKNGLNSDTSYIFCGDYIDRGNQNKEVLDWLCSIKELPNVCLLEGNHERHLYNFGNNTLAKSKVFEYKTKPELYNKGFDEKSARMLYRKFRQFSHFLYNGDEVLACHAGIPYIHPNLLYIPTQDFIKGVGKYEDYKTIAETWMGKALLNQYLVHGHRNNENDEIQIADRVFNLEGKVEFGGAIRIVELENIDGKNKWTTVQLDDCQPVTKELETENRNIDTISEAIKYLRNNEYIAERTLGDGISSFNFTRDAFYKGNWNKQTILARGLFIDTINESIVARSYEKFFRIGEVHATELGSLKDRFVFPVTAYVKENGFLAIVSYNKAKDDLFVASKSTNKGEYVDYIQNQLQNTITENGKSLYTNILEHFRDMYWETDIEQLSLVFECIDVVNDPHIIEYKENHLVLLDAIYNTLEFQKVPYSTLKDIAKTIGCEIKEKAYEFKDWDSFRDFYSRLQDEDYKYKETHIEGFVFEDQTGFMTKCKTSYYNEWKKLRTVADQTLRSGYITKTGMLTTALENMFYGFCKNCFEQDRNNETKEYPYKTDIINLRSKFEQKEIEK